MTSLEDVRGLADWLPGHLADMAPTITVVGDVMLDGWWNGTIERFCREAPAPVVELTEQSYAPGGAANTAMNLAALGARVRIAGLTGTDGAGTQLRELLTNAGVDTTHLIQHPGATTITKYRVLGGDQLMLRLDSGATKPAAAALQALADAVPAALADSAAVVICDYGSGALHSVVREALLAESPTGIVLVDAHDPRPWAPLRPDVATPNAAEAAQLLGLKWDGSGSRVDQVQERATQLLEATGARAVVVTLDCQGTVLLTSNDRGHRTWAKPVTEKQASGAGDTFVACLTLARAAGLPLTTAQDLAQIAADVVVRRRGTSVCTTADLAKYLGHFPDSVLEVETLTALITEERAIGKRIVLTNGCFDVLHRGHTRYLNQAKELGDVLVVALNDDASTCRLKGPDRPINALNDRAGVIAALSCVDYVTAFSTDNPIPLIETLHPDIYAKGGDYSTEMLEETEVVEAYGGVVRILDYVADHSTTAVVQKIQSRADHPTGQKPSQREAEVP